MYMSRMYVDPCLHKCSLSVELTKPLSSLTKLNLRQACRPIPPQVLSQRSTN